MNKHILYKVLDSDDPVIIHFDVQNAATAGTDLRLDGVHVGNFKHDFQIDIGTNKDMKGLMLSMTTVIAKVSGITQVVSAKFLIEGGSKPKEISFKDSSADLVIEKRYIIVFY